MFQEIVNISNQNVVKQLEETVNSESTQELKNLDDKAKLSFDTRDYSTALKTFLHIEESKNLTYNQRCMKADCLVRLFRKEEAQILIEEALKEDPYNVNMIYVQSLMHYYDLELEKCVDTNDRAIELDKLFMVSKDVRFLAISMIKILRSGKLFIFDSSINSNETFVL